MWFFLEGGILAMNHKFLKSFLGGKNSNADVHTLKQSPNTCKKSHQETINQNDFSTNLNYDPDKIKTREKSSERLLQT